MEERVCATCGEKSSDDGGSCESCKKPVCTRCQEDKCCDVRHGVMCSLCMLAKYGTHLGCYQCSAMCAGCGICLKIMEDICMSRACDVCGSEQVCCEFCVEDDTVKCLACK